MEHLESYMRFLIEDDRLYPDIVLTESDTLAEIVNDIKQTKKEADEKIEQIKKDLRRRVSKADMMVKARKLTMALADEKIAKWKMVAQKRIKVIAKNADSKIKRLRAKLAVSTNKKYNKAIAKKSKAKTMRKTLVTKLGPKAGTLLALSIAVATYGYNETMADAGKYCDNLSGMKKDECLKAFRNKARIRKINILTKEAGIRCKTSREPAECRRAYKRKIDRIRKKIK